MPPMNATGTKTAMRMRAMAITGPVTSRMAWAVASFGVMPCSMWCITASTTTMASSTTIPIASTRPSSESTLMEKPSRGNTMNVATSETGTVSRGISVARQFWRNTKTTRMTSTTASNRVVMISWMPTLMDRVVSMVSWYATSLGKAVAISVMAFSTASLTRSAFEPGVW